MKYFIVIILAFAAFFVVKHYSAYTWEHGITKQIEEAKQKVKVDKEEQKKKLIELLKDI